MMSSYRLVAPLLASALLAAVGCAGTAPNTTNGAPQTAQRTLLDADTPADEPLTEDQAKAQLPQRISVADAERLLVKIDENMIVKDKPYSVLRGGGRGGHGGHGGRGGFGHGHHGHGGFGRGGFGGFGWGGWGWGGLGWGGFGWPGYGFYGLGNYYYPYSLVNGYYSPYSYSPYLYGYGARSLYYPFI